MTRWPRSACPQDPQVPPGEAEVKELLGHRHLEGPQPAEARQPAVAGGGQLTSVLQGLRTQVLSGPPGGQDLAQIRRCVQIETEFSSVGHEMRRQSQGMQILVSEHARGDSGVGDEDKMAKRFDE